MTLWQKSFNIQYRFQKFLRMVDRHDITDFWIQNFFWLRPFFDPFFEFDGSKKCPEPKKLLMKKMRFYMPVNYAKKYLTFVQTVTVFLPLKFFFKMAAINPILKIKISNLKFISFFIYIFRKSLSNIGPRKVDPL